MSTGTSSLGCTWQLFPHTDAQAQERIGRALTGDGARSELGTALQRMRPGVRAMALSHVREQTAAWLGEDLTQAFLHTLANRHELHTAAQETIQAPGTRCTVELDLPPLTRTMPAELQLRIARTPPAPVRVRAQLSLALTEAVAEVTAGRLVAVQATECSLGATLTVHDQEALRGGTTRPLHIRLDLTTGIPLTAAAHRSGPAGTSADRTTASTPAAP